MILYNKPKLNVFLTTDLGFKIWDSQTLKMTYKNKEVFHLEMNEYIKKDKLNFIKKSKFTKNIYKYRINSIKKKNGEYIINLF